MDVNARYVQMKICQKIIFNIFFDMCQLRNHINWSVWDIRMYFVQRTNAALKWNIATVLSLNGYIRNLSKNPVHPTGPFPTAVLLMALTGVHTGITRYTNWSKGNLQSRNWAYFWPDRLISTFQKTNHSEQIESTEPHWAIGLPWMVCFMITNLWGQTWSVEANWCVLSWEVVSLIPNITPLRAKFWNDQESP